MNRASLLATAFILAPQAARAEGMPQLDVHNPLLWGQVFWGAAIFAVFYVLLSRSALPRVARVLETRRSRIEGDLEIARRAKAEADDAIAELKRARAEAQAQAQAHVDRVIDEARRQADTQAHDLDRRLADKIAESEARIAGARDRALQALPEIASETAHALASRLLGRDVPREVVANAMPRAAEG